MIAINDLVKSITYRKRSSSPIYYPLESFASSAEMADHDAVELATKTKPKLEQLPSGVEDAGAIPKGTIDPVYEAKARVLNHAVRGPLSIASVGRGDRDG